MPWLVLLARPKVHVHVPFPASNTHTRTARAYQESVAAGRSPPGTISTPPCPVLPVCLAMVMITEPRRSPHPFAGRQA